MRQYQPPFQLTHAMLARVAEIAEAIGVWRAAHAGELVPQLRRGNRIKTIQASLAIEHNTLTLEQVTAVLDGKPVLGLPREIQEVRNAFAAYETLNAWQPHRFSDLLAAHALLLRALVDDAGQLRARDVGIYRGDRLMHMAPPAREVPRLIEELLQWLARTDAHPLIASCAFHYDFEFIHPFSDGNGRMGRLWQTLILSRWQPMLAYLPVETVIQSRQDDYYRLLSEADRAADCSAFIQFLLDAINAGLQQALANSPTTPETTQETSQETTQERLLALLRDNPALTRHALAAALGITPDGVKYQLNKLKAAGRIRRVGSTKGGYWEVVL